MSRQSSPVNTEGLIDELLRRASGHRFLRNGGKGKEKKREKRKIRFESKIFAFTSPARGEGGGDDASSSSWLRSKHDPRTDVAWNHGTRRGCILTRDYATEVRGGSMPDCTSAIAGPRIFHHRETESVSIFLFSSSSSLFVSPIFLKI